MSYLSEWFAGMSQQCQWCGYVTLFMTTHHDWCTINAEQAYHGLSLLHCKIWSFRWWEQHIWKRAPWRSSICNRQTTTNDGQRGQERAKMHTPSQESRGKFTTLEGASVVMKPAVYSHLSMLQPHSLSSIASAPTTVIVPVSSLPKFHNTLSLSLSLNCGRIVNPTRLCWLLIEPIGGS